MLILRSPPMAFPYTVAQDLDNSRIDPVPHDNLSAAISRSQNAPGLAGFLGRDLRPAGREHFELGVVYGRGASHIGSLNPAASPRLMRCRTARPSRCETPAASRASSPERVTSAPSPVSAVNTKLVASFQAMKREN